MEDKLRGRQNTISLALKSRFRKTNESPKNGLKTNYSNRVSNAANVEMIKSSSIFSMYSDGGIDCTPPHKKAVNLNDSLDYSPHMLDSSFSPSTFISQSMGVESPEVGWKWNNFCGSSVVLATHTPDSAIIRDTSYASSHSSSLERGSTSNANKIQMSSSIRRRKQRRRIEDELRKLERIRAEHSLKQRCIKLQEQLKNAGTSKSIKSFDKLAFEEQEWESEADIFNLTNFNIENDKQKMTPQQMTTTVVKNDNLPDFTNSQAEQLDEFFNDSFTDLMLSSATEEIESKMYTQSPQKTEKSTPEKKLPTSNICDSNYSATPTNSKSEKRSFYMKFLEDDCTDDLLLSLDDVILQDNQVKKTKPFQRYKSMPTTNHLEYQTEPVRKPNTVKTNNTTSSTANSRCMKRHSSSHLLSPIASNNSTYNGRSSYSKK